MIAQGFFWFFDITSRLCLNMNLKLLNLAQPAAKTLRFRTNIELELLYYSPWPAMPYPSMPGGRAIPETGLRPFQGWPTHRAGYPGPSSTLLDTTRRTPMLLSPSQEVVSSLQSPDGDASSMSFPDSVSTVPDIVATQILSNMQPLVSRSSNLQRDVTALTQVGGGGGSQGLGNWGSEGSMDPPNLVWYCLAPEKPPHSLPCGASSAGGVACP
jgi:hypothetical protein